MAYRSSMRKTPINPSHYSAYSRPNHSVALRCGVSHGRHGSRPLTSGARCRRHSQENPPARPAVRGAGRQLALTTRRGAKGGDGIGHNNRDLQTAHSWNIDIAQYVDGTLPLVH